MGHLRLQGSRDSLIVGVLLFKVDCMIKMRVVPAVLEIQCRE
jgi:hypothetical protein